MNLCTKCKRESICDLSPISQKTIGYESFCVFCDVCLKGHLLKFENAFNINECLTCHYHNSHIEKLKDKLLTIPKLRCPSYDKYGPRNKTTGLHMMIVHGSFDSINVECRECSRLDLHKNHAWLSPLGYYMLMYFHNEVSRLTKSLTKNDYDKYWDIIAENIRKSGNDIILPKTTDVSHKIIAARKGNIQISERKIQKPSFCESLICCFKRSGYQQIK
mgnify:CR=1 FL=1